MDIETLVMDLVAETLGGSLPPGGLHRNTPLLANPDFDSMAVTALLTGLEEQLDLRFDDGLDAQVFETIGSLVDDLTARRAA